MESSNIFFSENFQRQCLLIIFLNAYHILNAYFYFYFEFLLQGSLSKEKIKWQPK